MNSHALVIMWNGDDLPDYISQKIGEMLIVNNISKAENVTVVYKDANGIASSLLRDLTNLRQDNDADATAEAIRNAAIYIGKRFEASLTSTNSIGNLTTFAIELSNAVTLARRSLSFTSVGSSDELLSAIEILSTKEGTIPSAIARKYHITQNVINVIKKVYNSYSA